MGDRWGTKVREPNGNIRMQMNRGRGYKVLL